MHWLWHRWNIIRLSFYESMRAFYNREAEKVRDYPRVEGESIPDHIVDKVNALHHHASAFDGYIMHYRFMRDIPYKISEDPLKDKNMAQYVHLEYYVKWQAKQLGIIYYTDYPNLLQQIEDRRKQAYERNKYVVSLLLIILITNFDDVVNFYNRMITLTTKGHL